MNALASETSARNFVSECATMEIKNSLHRECSWSYEIVYIKHQDDRKKRKKYVSEWTDTTEGRHSQLTPWQLDFRVTPRQRNLLATCKTPLRSVDTDDNKQTHRKIIANTIEVITFRLIYDSHTYYFYFGKAKSLNLTTRSPVFVMYMIEGEKYPYVLMNGIPCDWVFQEYNCFDFLYSCFPTQRISSPNRRSVHTIPKMANDDANNGEQDYFISM